MVACGRNGFRSATVELICREAKLTGRYLRESFAHCEAFAIACKSLIDALEAETIAGRGCAVWV